MSGTGFYRIYSSLSDLIIRDNPPIGAIQTLSGKDFSEPVRTRVSALWKLLQVPQGDIENNYEFSIPNDDFDKVVALGDVITATSDVAENEIWNVKYVEVSDAFVISSTKNKDLVWTASIDISDPEARPVKLEPLLIGPDGDGFVASHQSFKLFKLLGAANA